MTPFRPIRIIVVFIVMALLAACTSSGSKASGLKPPAFEPNITTWALPLDSYVVTQTDELYAQELLYVACMKAAGIVVPNIDPAGYLPPNKNKDGYKLFSVSIAEKWGYHNGPAKLLPTPPQSFTAAQSVVDASCNSKANHQISDSMVVFVQGLEGAAYETALHDSRVLGDEKKWYTCMLPLGLPDLPDAPDEMPTERLAKQFGLDGPSNPDTTVILPPTKATPSEIRMATFDAQCRDSSGYTPTLYSVQVSAQLALIAQNSDKLSDALSDERSEQARIASVLQQYAR